MEIIKSLSLQGAADRVSIAIWVCWTCGIAAILVYRLNCWSDRAKKVLFIINLCGFVATLLLSAIYASIDLILYLRGFEADPIERIKLLQLIVMIHSLGVSLFAYGNDVPGVEIRNRCTPEKDIDGVWVWNRISRKERRFFETLFSVLIVIILTTVWHVH